MGTLGTEFKVGFFTLIAAGIIGYMFFVLSPDSFTSTGHKTYFTEVKDAAGIVTKTHVKTNGVIVGKVTAIDLKVNKTRIEIQVERQVKIPQGSAIAIKEKGLLGDVFLEIIRGDDVGVYVDEGDLIPPADDQVSISALISIAGSIGKDIKEVTKILAKVLGGKEGERNVASIVNDIRDLASRSRKIVEENRSDLRSLISNLERTSDTLRKVIGDKEKELGMIVSNVRVATRDLKVFSASVRDIVGGENREKIDKIIASFDNTMQDVEVTAKNVRLVAGKLERGEGTLGKLINDDKALSELERR